MNDQLGILIDDIYLLHEPGSRHPECPARLKAIREALEASGALARWRRVEPRPAHADELELVHHPSLLEHVERASRRAPAYLDPDTVVSTDSYRTALFAAGGVLECTEAICTGKLKRAFAFVRPPGHHAEPDKAMGFCLFNNVALAAAYARIEHKLDRVAVIDIDLHHGNGTQVCFYDNPHVLYVSSHQFPFYPGTGNFHEVGIREGAGFTVNFPLPEGSGDESVIPIYSKIVSPILEQYRPQLILVSAGFDAHFRDPLGGLKVTPQGYASVAASLIRAADLHCDGRICFVLEGGYDREALQECTRAVMERMECESPEPGLPATNGAFDQIYQKSRRGFGHFWKF
jgi:acetoin utilization deacetylase AcuC-like enzyme